ncbi:MAG: tRNA pseudouridine(55) synthase TruB [Gemmatimonadetes bacterium]|nr:tRNA pseudouridine(55) synthase TruB [Gemmatimonadota bacterium]
MNESPSDCILSVDKPEGPTSHDVVQAARKALSQRRIGHTGTLDPFASGLLLLCVGRATRLAEYLGALDKTYEAVAVLGRTTDTLDREGALVEERSGWESLDAARIGDALAGFRGDIEQMPPQYSAKKVGGVAAHRIARRGGSVELAASRVSVYSIELTEVDLPRIGLRVRCSTGTYIRALARDIGETLGVGAHLVSLRRTAMGRFSVERALPFDALADPDAVRAAALDPLDALGHLPTLAVDSAAAARLLHGGSVPCADEGLRGPVAVSHDGVLLAIGEWSEGALHPRKVFAE